MTGASENNFEWPLHFKSASYGPAGRLTQILFTEKENVMSNVRGVGGKQPLNELKVDGIQEVCYQQFPLDRMEPKINNDKDVRNAMDDVCRKTRGKQL